MVCVSCVFLKEIDIQADQFRETKAGVDPDKSLALMDARLMVRDRLQAKNMQSLKDEYGKLFDYTRFQRASEKTDQRLGENPDAFRARGRELATKYNPQQNKVPPEIPDRIQSIRRGLER